MRKCKHEDHSLQLLVRVDFFLFKADDLLDDDHRANIRIKHVKISQVVIVVVVVMH